MIRVLISPASDNRNLIVELQRIEAKTVRWPEKEFGPPGDYTALDDAIGNLFGYDWLLLKNASAARFVLTRLKKLNHSLHELDELRLCVIGEESAEAIRDSQLHIDLEIGSANGAFAALESYVGGRDALSGLNLLVPSANITQERFQSEFEAAGARFDSVTAYRTTSDLRALTQLNALLVGGGIDFVFFSNRAEIEELARLFDTDDLKTILRETSIICADQLTRTVANNLGLARALIPSEPTTDAVLRLISAAYTAR